MMAKFFVGCLIEKLIICSSNYNSGANNLHAELVNT